MPQPSLRAACGRPARRPLSAPPALRISIRQHTACTRRQRITARSCLHLPWAARSSSSSARRGRLYAANLQPTDETTTRIVEAYKARLAARPKLYGEVEVTAFGPSSGPVAPDGSADLVLFLRNLHNWMAAGIADKAFKAAFAALKPGGVLGIEEHRAAPGTVQDVLAADGYVQTAFALQLAQEAGFKLAAQSEINANPKDTKDHPFGVWTLPPNRLSAPRGQPPKPGFDHSKYDAIGESDRMTLKLVKPG